MTTSTLSDLTSTSGYLRVQWTLLGSGVTDFYAHRIYMRETGDTTWILAYEETDPDVTSHDYHLHQYMPNIPMDVSVVVATQAAGAAVVDGSHDDVNTATPDPETKFLLVDPYNESNNLELNLAAGDSFEDEYASSAMNVVGVGRRFDTGARIGRSGSLDLTFIDIPSGATARAQRRAIEEALAAQGEWWLRSPFGEAYHVALMGFSFERTPGVGTNSYGTGSLDYAETP